jgi:hypothetical protein
MMRNAVDSLLAAAVKAPSGDNTQPWRFRVDEQGRSILAEPDHSRDPSPMNVGGRMSRIALGAALENILRAARGLGLDAELAPAPPPAMASVRLNGEAGEGAAPAVAALAGRVTNRKAYDARPVAPDILEGLRGDTPDLDSVSTHWIVGADRLKDLGMVIGRADGTMFGDPSMRRGFLANVRFDAPDLEAVDEGLSLGSLELSGTDRVSLQVMKRVPDWFLKLGGASKVFASKARALVASSSGLCLVVAPDGADWTDLVVGRAMQRAWLSLASRGLAAQPMMSLCVLENARENGDEALRSALGERNLAEIRDAFRALVPEIGDGRLAFLMRFGFAPPPTGRTGRLAPPAVTVGEGVDR